MDFTKEEQAAVDRVLATVYCLPSKHHAEAIVNEIRKARAAVHAYYADAHVNRVQEQLRAAGDRRDWDACDEIEGGEVSSRD